MDCDGLQLIAKDCEGLRWIASQLLQVLELGVCARWPMIAIGCHCHLLIRARRVRTMADDCHWLPLVAIGCH